MAKRISELPIGAKVKFGKYQVETETPQPIIWQIADKNHIGYPDNSVTLMTEKIIDLRAFDGKEPSNPDVNRASYGNNRYSLSNIRQWLNKSDLNWFNISHTYDTAPNNINTNYNTGYDTKSGFLSNFTSEELAVILDTTLVLDTPTIDGGGSETIADKVFLPSKSELGFLGNDKLSLFKNTVNRVGCLTEQCFNNTKSTNKPNNILSNCFYWLRNIKDVSQSHTVICAISEFGSGGDFPSYGNIGIRPCCNISTEITVSELVDSDGCHVLFDNSTPPKIKDIITRLQDMQMLNGKSEITNVLGSPFANTDNPIQIVNKIQSIKNTMATNLTNKGVNSVGTETLNGLVNKLGSLPVKKWASGNISHGSNGLLVINNLAFRPQMVVVYGASFNHGESNFMFFSDLQDIEVKDDNNAYGVYVCNGSRGVIKTNCITSNGINALVPNQYSLKAYKFLASE